jgi:hypothetical protein
MEDSSFFRDQAERCRRLAEHADPMLQITLETLALDCMAYAAELDNPDDYWFANRAQTETGLPTKPRWSAMVMAPGMYVLAALKERRGVECPNQRLVPLHSDYESLEASG